MQRKSYWQLGLVFVSLAVLVMVLHAASRITQKDAGKESPKTCCEKKSCEPGNNDMLWDNLSGQFFSFSSSSY
jgi:hypothetical protein